MPGRLMNTREVAEYLRIKERKVYDLVAKRRIPCTRAAGKWLFPKALVDNWLLEHVEGPPEARAPLRPPAIIAGSHDPLLEWAARESDCGLAVLFDGSLDGLERFAAGAALCCGMHAIDAASGEYNAPWLARAALPAPAVAIEWAWREQGLVLAPGNPLGLGEVADLRRARLVARQPGAGSTVLLDHLLARAGMSRKDLPDLAAVARSETDVALAVADGKADAGLGIAAVARQLRLDFVPLWRERFDLVVWRREYFSAPFQDLLRYVATPAFARRAAELTGYDLGGAGTVRYNAP